jgi:hypothetical protein
MTLAKKSHAFADGVGYGLRSTRNPSRDAPR